MAATLLFRFQEMAVGDTAAFAITDDDDTTSSDAELASQTRTVDPAATASAADL